MIRAEVHSDDRAYEIDFDATAYFVQASDEDLFKLAKDDWGGGYPADWVAEYFEKTNRNIKAMFRYLRSPEVRERRDAPGFECYVKEADAMEWLKKNRPLLAKAIEKGWKGCGPRDWAP